MSYLTHNDRMMNKILPHLGARIWLTGPPSELKRKIGLNIELELWRKGVQSFYLDMPSIDDYVQKSALEVNKRTRTIVDQFLKNGSMIIAPIDYISHYSGECDIEINLAGREAFSPQAHIFVNDSVKFKEDYDTCSINKEVWRVLKHKNLVQDDHAP